MLEKHVVISLFFVLACKKWMLVHKCTLHSCQRIHQNTYIYICINRAQAFCMHACMYANLIFYTYVCVLSGFAAGPGSGPCPAAKPDKTHTRRVGRLIDLPYGLSQVSFLFCDERYGQLRSLLPQRQTCRDTRWTKKAHGQQME